MTAAADTALWCTANLPQRGALKPVNIISLSLHQTPI